MITAAHAHFSRPEGQRVVSASEGQIIFAFFRMNKNYIQKFTILYFMYQFGTDIGAQLTINGFMSVFPGKIAATCVAICLSLFAISTVLTWALYGTRCVEFLMGYKASKAQKARREI